MTHFEYKTVALPRSVAQRRRRRQTEADLVAEQLGKVLNEEAVDGWEYLRAETLTTPGHSGTFKKVSPAAYVVLIFQRARDGHLDTAQPSADHLAPTPPVAAPQSPAPTMAAQPEPDLRFATTSVQLMSTGDPQSQGTVTQMRPLGPATE